MIAILLTVLYLFALLFILPAVFFIGHSGFRPEKFRNWRLARTCFTGMVLTEVSMIFALRSFETIPDGWGVFILFTAVLFSAPMGLYADTWMRYDVRNTRAIPEEA